MYALNVALLITIVLLYFQINHLSINIQSSVDEIGQN
jgi:hypothetical protein